MLLSIYKLTQGTEMPNNVKKVFDEKYLNNY